MSTLLIIVLGLVIVGSLWVRLAPYQASDWIVDPDTAHYPGRDRQKRVQSGELTFDVAPEDLAAAVDRAAMAQPRVTRLTGGADSFDSTYMQRTLWMGYPDFITLKVSPSGTGSTLALFSRSRFGRRDFGVNAARVKTWVAAIRAEL